MDGEGREEHPLALPPACTWDTETREHFTWPSPKANRRFAPTVPQQGHGRREGEIWKVEGGRKTRAAALGPFSANEEITLAQASPREVQQACPSIWPEADPIDNISSPWEYRVGGPCTLSRPAPFPSVLCGGSRAPDSEKQGARLMKARPGRDQLL